MTDLQAVLNTPLQTDDVDAHTVREYLIKLLATVWNEGEEFSGKRPFGNSGWQEDLYAALVRADLAEGHFDEDGYTEDVDRHAADKLIASAIQAL